MGVLASPEKTRNLVRQTIRPYWPAMSIAVIAGNLAFFPSLNVPLTLVDRSRYATVLACLFLRFILGSPGASSCKCAVRHKWPYNKHLECSKTRA